MTKTCFPLHAKENDISNVVEEMNKVKEVLEDDQVMLDCIACEIQGQASEIYHSRMFLENLRSEVRRLRTGQLIETKEGDQFVTGVINP